MSEAENQLGEERPTDEPRAEDEPLAEDQPAAEPFADDEQGQGDENNSEYGAGEPAGESDEAAEELKEADGARPETEGPTDAELASLDAEGLRDMIRGMHAQHAEQLDTESRARAEVEDMCLRIEKHFKAEKAARAKAEELMQQAIESELATKSQLEMEQQRLSDLDNDLELDREKMRQERDALEGMRIDFEHELQAAQSEVGKAQDALRTAEERVRAAEQVEQQKIISDYEQRILAMSTDMMKMRDDMQQRTLYMTREMQRYQQAAVNTSNAMMSAKKEMQERRKDVDAMRSKLDSVMERLYSGHEHNMTLQSNIGCAQDHAGQLFHDPYLSGMMASSGLVPADMQMPGGAVTEKPARGGRGMVRFGGGRGADVLPPVAATRKGTKAPGAPGATKGAAAARTAPRDSTGRFRRAADMATW